MRRPTLSELLMLIALWLATLLPILKALMGAGRYPGGSVPCILLCALWTYRYCNAAAYEKMKAEQAAHKDYMIQRFGRWHLLVEWIPFFFLLFMVMLSVFFRRWAILLVIIGLIGFFLFASWIASLRPKSNSK